MQVERAEKRVRKRERELKRTADAGQRALEEREGKLKEREQELNGAIELQQREVETREGKMKEREQRIADREAFVRSVVDREKQVSQQNTILVKERNSSMEEQMRLEHRLRKLEVDMGEARASVARAEANLEEVTAVARAVAESEHGSDEEETFTDLHQL